MFGDLQSSAEKREKNSLSAETALENGQRWDDEQFWEKYAQPLDEEEDTQPVFEEKLRFSESAPHDTECSSSICSVCLVNTCDCIIIPCRHCTSCYKCTIQLRSCCEKFMTIRTVVSSFHVVLLLNFCFINKFF